MQFERIGHEHSPCLRKPCKPGQSTNISGKLLENKYGILCFIMPYVLVLCWYCCFLQIEDLWQPCIKQVCWCHSSKSILSLCVIVSHFGILIIFQAFPSFSSVQFSSVTQSCTTLCDPMDCSTPVLPVHHQFPECTQIHVHWVGDAIQSPHPLSSPSPPALNLSQH